MLRSRTWDQMAREIVEMEGTMTSQLNFRETGPCWVCEGTALTRFHEAQTRLHERGANRIPELAAYTGEKIWLRRCAACRFAQPERIPALPRFFERMYDQRWSPEWVAEEVRFRTTGI